ncbi:unnamed protein product [Cuscuta campestris]|uniref:Uncharacterized protein n=1 Tax=Cuscuta campestris TaxID=132261 RepID=A0A484MZZ6_9ASTE|nr:unnamed protein product [Cuscuta campestris]
MHQSSTLLLVRGVDPFVMEEIKQDRAFAHGTFWAVLLCQHNIHHTSRAPYHHHHLPGRRRRRQGAAVSAVVPLA